LCHVPDSLCAGIKVAYNKLAQEKTCTKLTDTYVQVSSTRQLAQVSGTSYLRMCHWHKVVYDTIVAWHFCQYAAVMFAAIW